ncbi:MAG: hypothetical protein DRZ79_03430 [Candidatus Cloacimonadota bacterium]|nr:MAG: hypothetical protein DRZ79_03430 [Candidatus Cloacimonadota bacterium]
MIFKKKNFLDRFFKRSLDSEQLNFSALIRQRQNLIVMFSENPAENFEILSYLKSWFEIFEKNTIILPAFQIAFFEKIVSVENLSFRVFSSRISAYENSIVLNFNGNQIARKIIASCKNSIVCDIDNFSNVRFYPLPQNPISLLREFAAFFNLEIQPQKITVAFGGKHDSGIKTKFLHNKFPHFIIHLREMKADKNLEILIKKMKFYFSANIYLTGVFLKNHDFPNLENLKISNLLELFRLARACDIFLTDDKNLANIFSHFEINQVFIGKENKKINSRNIHVYEEDKILELVNMIQEILKK